MYHIARVSIDGFWETHNIELDLFPEVTFLIGPNGTGKTTLINLLAAALTADFRTLDRMPFKRITIHLSSLEANDQPRIIVQKTKRNDRPFELIEYRLRSGQSGAAEMRYSLEDIEEQYLMRRFASDSRSMYDHYRRMSSGLTASLQKLVHVNWLSVHRTPTIDRQREDRSYESSVDQRIEAISNDLVRYFATMSREKDDEVRKFQESIFVSLLEKESELDLFDTNRLEYLGEYRDTLANIFRELHVETKQVQRLITDFIERATLISDDRDEDGSLPPLSLEDAIVLMQLRRISDVVERWHKLQNRLSEIFKPRDNWNKITNSLIQRKEMELTASNEIQFVSRSGKVLTLQTLSSGEKQLLILLSETLLQRGRPAIFIADEPELSLHVLWQEKLVGSLRALNPSAQIIAATHSPDIVGTLGKYAIDMETLIP